MLSPGRYVDLLTISVFFVIWVIFYGVVKVDSDFVEWVNGGEEYISRERLSELLGIRVETLMQNVARGRWNFRVLRVGGFVLFSRSDILGKLGG